LTHSIYCGTLSEIVCITNAAPQPDLKEESV